ncbi:MAG: hypothetical protein VKL42_00945 [Snowella sp.]|nr:hypothetical protein [Snowella sp.]
MENFDIYVKTSAMGQTGIHWRQIGSDDEQPIKTPTLIQDKILTNEDGYPIIVNDLLDEVKPSLLIYRKNGQILLEIAGTESPERSSRMGRKVLNLIVWIAEDNDENEKIIRKIAYSGIQNILGDDLAFSRMIQESIDFYEREEFRCDRTKVNEYVNRLDDVDSAENPNLEQLISIKSDDYLTKLAEDIKKYSLPQKWNDSHGKSKEDGVLVVVTEQLEQKDIFYLAEVWRGFASNVEKIKSNPPETVSTVPEITAIPTPNSSTEEEVNTGKKYMVILMAIIVILIIVMSILVIQPKVLKHPPTQTPPNQENSQYNQNSLL